MCAPAQGAMPGMPTDGHGCLNTALIFDETVYLREALNLPSNQTEDELEAELALLAQESCITDPYRFLKSPQDISRALSTVTLDVDSDDRSSTSIHSQETQSTSFTSAPSRTSRDQVYNERSAAQRKPTLGRPSPSDDIQNQAPILEGSIPVIEQRRSTSTLSVAQSVLSSSSSLSSSAPRRKRGSGLFGMFRKDSSPCTSQSHHGLQNRGWGIKLECGHSLSTHAVRVHIQEAEQSARNAVPSCCGKPLPHQIVDPILAKDEADTAINSILQSPDVGALRDSGYSETKMSSVELYPPEGTPSIPLASTSLPVTSTRRRYEAINIDCALAHEAFKSFRIQEKDQFGQVSAFECNQRKALSTHHQCSLKRLALQYGTNREEKVKQHSHDLEHLEEMQIIAEHDLREAHGLETQNVATALKHMEAYCIGSSSSRLHHPHIVTEEDFRKLDRQRMTQQNLPRKHENMINVLRARQEREMKNRLQKQKIELELMDADLERKMALEEAEYKKDVEKLEALIEIRRKRLQKRWDLRFEMWRRDWEEQHGTTFPGELEHEQWPLPLTNNTTPIPESSSLALFLQAAA